MTESPLPTCRICGEPLASPTMIIFGNEFHVGCAPDAMMPVVQAAAVLVDGWYAVGSENEGNLYRAMYDLRGY